MRDSDARALAGFQDALSIASSVQDFETCAAKFAIDIGYRWFTYFSTGESFEAISSYPREWLKQYWSAQYQLVDPIVKRATNSRMLFHWAAEDFKNDRSAGAMFDEAAAFGLKNGVVIPLGQAFGRKATMTFVGTFKDGLNASDLGGIDVLTLGAVYFDAFYMAAGFKKPQALDLNLKERQCLTWIARGKTSAETAQIIGITDRGLAYHVASIKQKLHAATLPQAVAIAVQAGELFIS